LGLRNGQNLKSLFWEFQTSGVDDTTPSELVRVIGNNAKAFLLTRCWTIILLSQHSGLKIYDASGSCIGRIFVLNHGQYDHMQKFVTILFPPLEIIAEQKLLIANSAFVRNLMELELNTHDAE